MTYRFVYDEGIGGLLPNPPEYVTITYGTPFIAYYHMNWGWGGYNDGTWYTISGDWEAQLDDGSANFIYKRKIISGYSVIY